MNNDKVEKIIQGLGAMVEVWTIVYKGFKDRKMSDDDALMHTKAFMTVVMSGITGADNEES